MPSLQSSLDCLGDSPKERRNGEENNNSNGLNGPQQIQISLFLMDDGYHEADSS